VARRHTTLFRPENRYANLRANPSNLARPFRLPLQRLDGCVPSTVDTLVPLLLISLSTKLHLPSLSLSLALSLAIRIVSLYHCACGARSDSENAFFPSRRAPVRAGGLRPGAATGGGKRATMGEGL